MPPDASTDVLRSSTIADHIRATKLIAVLRRIEPQSRLLELAEALAGDGIRTFEVTFDGPTAPEDLRAVRQLLDETGPADAIVGAGTIRSIDALDTAREAGAAFAVSPGLDVDVVRRSIAHGLPCIPGAYTPTEVDAALRAGATFVKLFPASSLGPTHVRELRGPFPEIETIATGGVDATNARAFLDAGCVAVGIGGALVRATPAERRALVAEVSGQP
ncbi:MAG TPA: bifunctional 4-hydroxy-2-oxoglutarate aldolase/2-dehydro-3-deoxy-phosphogluconate aldolase [Candidatus Limnocylindrales bacterium]